mmetsp:Transcript_36529/g.71845  ORF Transcript_36529/g.71845 Transcript_36529/m.71845 type:complete len:95 (-) Transcript_36529:1615-1899(-)
MWSAHKKEKRLGVQFVSVNDASSARLLIFLFFFQQSDKQQEGAFKRLLSESKRAGKETGAGAPGRGEGRRRKEQVAKDERKEDKSEIHVFLSFL